MAYDFNGTNQYLQINTAIVSAAPFSISVLYDTDSTTVDQAVVGIADAGGSINWWQLYLDGASSKGIRLMAYKDPTLGFATTSTSFGANTWEQAGGVETSSASRAAYRNGGSKGTDTASVAPVGIDNVSIGRLASSTPANYVNGEEADVGLWSRAISDDEQSGLGKKLSPLFFVRGLVAYWPLIASTQDIVGGYNMTAFNSPTVTDHPETIYPGGFMFGFQGGGF